MLVRGLRRLREWWLRVAHGRRGLPRRVNGIDLRVLPQFRWYFTPEYDRPVAGLLHGRVRPGSVCVSVGANLGIYPLQFAAWSAPNGMVHAFEPNPATADALTEHVQLNDLTGRVKVVRKALADRTGEASFFASGVNGMSRLGAPNPALAESAARITVSVGTLDDYCRANGVAPDVIMIDVEGFEQAVLAGAKVVLSAEKFPAVVVEMHPNAWVVAGSNRQRFEELLASLRLRPVPLSGQSDAMAEYGHVLLVRDDAAECGV